MLLCSLLVVSPLLASCRRRRRHGQERYKLLSCMEQSRQSDVWLLTPPSRHKVTTNGKLATSPAAPSYARPPSSSTPRWPTSWASSAGSVISRSSPQMCSTTCTTMPRPRLRGHVASRCRRSSLTQSYRSLRNVSVDVRTNDSSSCNRMLSLLVAFIRLVVSRPRTRAKLGLRNWTAATASL